MVWVAITLAGAVQEPSCDNLDMDFNYFDTNVWPLLAQLVPAFEGVKVHNAWADFYEHNTFDENGIIGMHQCYGNLAIATGYSGYGKQFTFRPSEKEIIFFGSIF